MTYNDIFLPGLVGSNPLGAMAAFGLLRVCSEISDLAGTRLHWIWDQDWRAMLRVPQAVGREELIEHLVLCQKDRSLSVFNWSDDIKVDPETYREQMLSHIINSSLYHRLALHMTAGQQKFLKLISKDLAKSMAKKTAQAYDEALFGPWRREDDINSLGWDPSAKRLHALRHRSPSSDVFHCVRAAIWLAVEALPLYPTASISNRLQTTGFTMIRPMMFSWPIWGPPISLDTLRTLIMTSDSKTSLRRRGVKAIYHSERAESSQGGAFLRPSVE